jgi:hypothetical protein
MVIASADEAIANEKEALESLITAYESTGESLPNPQSSLFGIIQRILFVYCDRFSNNNRDYFIIAL